MGLARIDPAPKPSFALIDLANQSHATFQAVSHALPTTGSLLGTQRPGEVNSYADVRAMPQLLALLLGLLSIGVLAHVLISSARARRREFALLKAIGLIRRQIVTSAMWEATALAVAATGCGLFLGLIANHLLWGRFTDDLGVRAPAIVPIGLFAATATALIIITNLIALIPARRSARFAPAPTLRAE